MKSFRPKDGDDNNNGADSNPELDFHGHKTTNNTHESTADPLARIYCKGNGEESKLCFMVHALMENRNGLAVGVMVTQANSTAEREAVLKLVSLPYGKRPDHA